MTDDLDALVIGTGSAGTAAATALRKGGRSVAIVDERPFGGTCVLRGCDPKKVLVAAARVVDEAQRLTALGIMDAPTLHWPALMRFKRTFTDPMPEQRERTYKEAGVRALHGTARFTAPDTVAIGDETLHPKHVVIATGARPTHVVSGDDVLLTSEAFLELERMPQSLLFVGGGYIAFELAHVAARAGAKVTILHRDAHPLRGFDADAVDVLVKLSREIGIDVVLNATVESVTRKEGAVVADARIGGTMHQFRSEAGVLAAGREPDLDRLALEAGGVERTKRGVKVDAHLQSTSNARIYAAGDAADDGGLPLTPVAGSHGEIVAENILNGNPRTFDARGLASMVYTIPPLGTVGMTHAQAQEHHIDVDVRSGDMTSWYSTRHVAGRAAFYKVLLERGSRTILGATVFGPHAEEQINVVALAIRNGLNADAVASALYAYPTGSSDMEYLLA